MRNIDWTLLVIAAASGARMTPVQLQKSLFLLGRNLDETQLKRPSLYNFEPYDYGPFDSKVYSDAESLESEGLISIDAGGRYREYWITATGSEQARQLRHGLDSEATKYLDEVVRWVLPKTFGQLVRAIYNSYPEMREKSVFKY
jgi:hypothetical protein